MRWEGAVVRWVSCCPYPRKELVYIGMYVESYCLKGACSSSRLSCSVQLSSVAQSCPTLCNPMDCSMPGFPVHHQIWSLLKIMCIELVMPSNHLILCHPLPLLSSIFPSIRVFSNESVLCIRWTKYWSFSFTVSIIIEYYWVSGVSIIIEYYYSINIQDWFPLGWTGWISLQSKGLSRVFSLEETSLLWCR